MNWNKNNFIDISKNQNIWNNNNSSNDKNYNNLKNFPTDIKINNNNKLNKNFLVNNINNININNNSNFNYPISSNNINLTDSNSFYNNSSSNKINNNIFIPKKLNLQQINNLGFSSSNSSSSTNNNISINNLKSNTFSSSTNSKINNNNNNSSLLNSTNSNINKNTNSNNKNNNNNKIKTNKNKTNSTIHRLTSSILKSNKYNSQEYILSIIENYAREVGITAFNFRTMEFFITQFIDNESYINTLTMINYWRPIEIVMNQKSENTSIHLMIKSIFNSVYIGFQLRKNFNEDFGKEIYLKSLIKELNTDEISIKYVCMASLSGLIKYLENNPNYNITDNYYIHYHYLENHLNISFNTTVDLELLINKKYKKTFGSLFSLFHCRTISGSRLLRSNILQPFTNENNIKQRQIIVNELICNKELYLYLKDNIVLFKELEIYISKLMHKINNFEGTINVLKNILEAIEGIRNCLSVLNDFNDRVKNLDKNKVLVNITNYFDNKIFSNILENINEYINEYDTMKYNDNNNKKELNRINRKSENIFFLIKDGINNVLDISRKTYTDTLNAVYNEYEKLKNLTNDPNIKLCYSENKGYYININEKYFDEKNFEIYKKNGKKISCSNNTLISLSQRIKEIKGDLIECSFNNLENIIVLLRKKINYLYVMSGYIANLDVLIAFADYALNSGKLCTPKIIYDEPNNNNNNYNNNNFIYGKNCRHPLLEKFYDIYNNNNNNNIKIIPNDYFYINPFNILLIKGPNASGKTTYMKQLSLLIILSQIGSLIPCDFFYFKIRNFIFSKFDNNDCIYEQRGSFISQIIEIQKVINSNSKNSLILLDEPFENYMNYDILAISISLLDYFSKKFNGSYIIISSHNDIISWLSNFYFGCINGCMEISCNENEFDFLYKMKFKKNFLDDNYIDNEDNNNKDNIVKEYGIILAGMINLNEEIIENSIEIFKKSFRSEKKKFEKDIRYSKEMNYVKYILFDIYYKIFEIINIKENYVLEEEIKEKLIDLKNYINNIFN